MKHSIIFISLLFCLVTNSQEYKEYPEYTAELKDITVKEVLGVKSNTNNKASKAAHNALAFLKKLDHSVFQLHEGCGAVLTSNTGYAITALHCFNDLPRSLPSPLKIETIFTTDNDVNITSYLSDSNMEGYEYNRWAFNPVRLSDHKDLLPLKLVTFGKGFPNPNKNWLSSRDSITDNAEIIKQYVDDYAIIKLKKMPKNYKCVKSASTMPEDNKLTWTAGYPVHTAHKQTYLTLKTLKDLKFKSDFLFPSISEHFNRAIAAISEQKNESWFSFEANQHTSPFYVAIGRSFSDYKELKQKFSFPMVGKDSELLDLITDKSKYLVSTSFNKPGFSGGGIFNTNQELIGINSMAPAAPIFLANKFKPLMSHVRIDYIKNQVLEKFGEDMLNKIFDCE